MIFETSRRRSVSLCHSWQFKICFVWGGELVSTLTSLILQMGLIWHIALTTESSSLLSLASLAGFLPIALFGVLAGAVVDRLPLKRVLIGADLFVAAVAPPWRLPRWPAAYLRGQYSSPCFSAQLALRSTRRPPNPLTPPSRPARASRSPIGSDAGRFSPPDTFLAPRSRQ